MTEIRQFLVFLLVAGVLLGVAATVSFIEESGLSDGNAYEEGVAGLLLSGNNVGNIKNYDERLLQKILIQNDRRQVDEIVLGSSRSYQIHNCTCMRRINPDKIFLNHAVSLATLEDDIAILELYAEEDRLPRTVIIGADPWILNANNDQTKWKTLEPEYRQGLARIGAPPVRSEQVFENIVSDINQITVFLSRDVLAKSLYQLMRNQITYYPTDREELDVTVKNKDGSISYAEEMRNTTADKIDASARAYANTVPIFGLGRFTRIDEGSREHFEAAVRYLQSRNVTVILFLAPYHPIVYETIATDPRYANVKAVESYFREFAATENITVVGSYDPGRFNLTSGDFIDGAHPRREVVDSLFTRVASVKTNRTGG
jgi:hypothetical protein